MVVKMMKWRPWPPSVANKYEVKLVVNRLDGFSWANNISNNPVREGVSAHDGDHPPQHQNQKVGTYCGESRSGLRVEIKWKGSKVLFGSVLRRRRRKMTGSDGNNSSTRKNKRDSTEEVREVERGDGNGSIFLWEEEFQNECDLSAYKDSNVFVPWEINFTLLNTGTKPGLKNKVPAIGTASLNLADYASQSEKEFELNIPLMVSAGAGGATDPPPSLNILLSLVELQTSRDVADSLPKSIVPVPLSGESPPAEKDELSALKAGLRKVKILTEYVSARRVKKAFREVEEGSSEGRDSALSEDGYRAYPFDSDSLEEFDEGEVNEAKVDDSIRKSFSYDTLPYANYAGGLFLSTARIDSGDEGLIYYSNRNVGCLVADDPSVSSSDPSILQTSKRSILPWRKRKLGFRSPKAKGEPLLKKAYAEEGGDDIDYDRRQLSSDEALPSGWHKVDEDSSAHRSSVSEFGDDSFAVGSWEQREIMSRDGHMKLCGQVFFASIDQRSERAAGESACTALVAVIADWFQNNSDLMPIKSQFDSLIRDGSQEWRKLCEDETYRERFPDKHFDLETVIQSKIRPLSVHPGKSFIGFFLPDEMEEGRFDFLHGAMSFDSMWDEITRTAGSESDVYIVSWNDHFFILKVEAEAYYIIDTLGERLFEGCNQAYILKFDRDTRICKLPAVSESSSEGKPAADQLTVATPGAESGNKLSQQIKCKDVSVKGVASGPMDAKGSDETRSEEEMICEGKECCKEYIKNFLAAIPIRELLVDLKKGFLATTPLHHRLQIELHYTQAVPPSIISNGPVSVESTTNLTTISNGPNGSVSVDSSTEHGRSCFLVDGA